MRNRSVLFYYEELISAFRREGSMPSRATNGQISHDSATYSFILLSSIRGMSFGFECYALLACPPWQELKNSGRVHQKQETTGSSIDTVVKVPVATGHGALAISFLLSGKS
jgi:hypothetical protein